MADFIKSWVCGHVAIKSLLLKHGYKADDLPTSVIIATCQLDNCLRVNENHETWAVLEDGRIVSGNDFFLGDFKVGGYVWKVRDMKMLKWGIHVSFSHRGEAR